MNYHVTLFFFKKLIFPLLFDLPSLPALLDQVKFRRPSFAAFISGKEIISYSVLEKEILPGSKHEYLFLLNMAHYSRKGLECLEPAWF